MFTKFTVTGAAIHYMALRGKRAAAHVLNSLAHCAYRSRRTHRRYRASNDMTNIWSVAYGYDADDNISTITDLVDATRSLELRITELR